MKKLYKDGSECMADDHQADLMINAGWSLTKPAEKSASVVESEESVDEVAESTEEVEDAEAEDDKEEVILKKIPRKRIKKG